MKLTPLDIHHKEFGRAIRGYNEAEVDEFLDQVADELERLFKENIDLNERLEAADERVRTYQEMERTLHNTLLSAQKSAEDIVAKSRHESEVVLKDAEVKAKEIIHNALQQKQRNQSELVRIKQAEEDFRAAFKALLEKHLAGITPVPLPADVAVLSDEVDGEVISGVDVAAVAVSQPEPAVFEPAITAYVDVEPQLEPAAEAFEPEPAIVEAAATEAEVVAPEVQEPAAEAEPEPEVPTVVEGVLLGEVVSPQLPDEEPTFDVPEFTPGFFQFGERDDDLDIEEID